MDSQPPSPTPPGLTRLGRLILVLVAFGASMVMAEVVVRVGRGAMFDTTLLSAEYRAPSGRATETTAQYDAELGWIPLLGRSEQRGAEYNIKRRGIRSNGQPTPDGEPILVLGDSFAFGLNVGDSDTWPAQLEQIVHRPTLNAAVFSYGLDQSVLRGETLLDAVAPARTLIGLIPDDINRCAQSSRAAAKPYFTVVDGGLSLHNVPVPTSEPRRPMDGFRRSLGYSHFVDAIMRRVAPVYWLDLPMELAWGGGFDVEENADPVGIACLLMNRVAGWNRGGRVSLVVQYPRDLERGAVPVVLECARSAGIHVIDLHSELSAMAGSSAFDSLWDETGHMSPAGNALVARWVAESL